MQTGIQMTEFSSCLCRVFVKLFDLTLCLNFSPVNLLFLLILAFWGSGFVMWYRSQPGLLDTSVILIVQKGVIHTVV